MTLQDDYRTIREGAAIGAISPRNAIAVSGRDRASFLQGLLTNDIVALTPGTGCYAAWLTPQGRMLTDMHVLESGEMILLDVPEDQAASTLQRLDQFLFGEEVTLVSLAGSVPGVWVHGPDAGRALAAVLGAYADGEPGFDAWPEYHHDRLSFDAAPVVVARISQLGVPGFCVYLEAARRDAFVAALEAAGAKQVSQGALDAARIEAGYPVFGVDMTDDTIPLEATIEDRAISFTKGCYVGQEVVIRVLHRGGGRVAKKLVAARIDGAVPERGARLYAGAKDIGAITSVADSPRLGAIALAYVHRDFTAPGQSVEVETSAGRVPLTVTARPIPSAA